MKLALGLGCRRGVGADELERALNGFLAGHGCRRGQLAVLASCEIKRDEAGLLELARRLQLEIIFFSISELSRVRVPSPSLAVHEKIGVYSVAEAAALLAGGGELVAKKEKFTSLTLALAWMERS
ncbi:MAG TPA: cobalamin biosynthesis protein [Proteobacteria bacterium]|nr:cobalamin biosynthesis protein [Pseudomonadota bacterium]